MLFTSPPKLSNEDIRLDNIKRLTQELKEIGRQTELINVELSRITCNLSDLSNEALIKAFKQFEFLRALLVTLSSNRQTFIENIQKLRAKEPVVYFNDQHSYLTYRPKWKEQKGKLKRWEEIQAKVDENLIAMWEENKSLSQATSPTSVTEYPISALPTFNANSQLPSSTSIENVLDNDENYDPEVVKILFG